MGLFSSIGKAFKSVFAGIMKVFSPILKPLGKLMNSSLGKAIMIGLSIFTLGTAMVAGYGAFSAASAAGSGFIASFVEGGKVFLSTLVGKGAEEGAAGAAEGVQTAAGATDQALIASETGSMAPQLLEGTQSVIDAGGGAMTEAAGSMATGPGITGDVTTAVRSGGQGVGGAGQGAMFPEMAGDAEMVAKLAETGGGGGALTEGAGWLDKAKGAAKGMFEEGGFLRSEGGGQIAGALISGVGNYYTEKDRQEFEDRIRRSWGQGSSNAGIRSIRASGARAANMQAPTGVPAAGRATARDDPAANRPYFEREYGASAPAGAGG